MATAPSRCSCSRPKRLPTTCASTPRRESPTAWCSTQSKCARSSRTHEPDIGRRLVRAQHTMRAQIDSGDRGSEYEGQPYERSEPEPPHLETRKHRYGKQQQESWRVGRLRVQRERLVRDCVE